MDLTGRSIALIEFRGAAQSDAETLAQYAGVPVRNALTTIGGQS